ncbi:MAG: DUF2339 domain-containing protein [Xanthobacteraceae bacterium]
MFDGIVIIVLIALAFPVIAVIALVQASSLGGVVRRLEVRVIGLERAIAAFGAGTAPAPPPAAPVAARIPTPPPPAPVQTEPIVPPPVPPVAPATSAVPSAPMRAPSSPPRIGFEERFGTRWLVWVGGIALTLGGIFVVRYTIQEGLIGPGVRIMLGALLALILVAAGEWTRRKENLSGLPGLPTAHIPGILTAAGTTVAYATVYAAYGLYNFLPPGVAFVLMGLVALLTLTAALLHGPALAGLGVIGAYLAPLLVSTTQPDYWALYIYIAVVTAVSFALARLRLWRWHALAAIKLSAAWTLPGMTPGAVTAVGAHAFNTLAGFALAAVFLVCGLLYGPDAKPGELDRVSVSALSIYLLAAALLVLASRHDATALTVFVVLTIGTVAVAWRAEAASGAVPVAAVLAMVVMAHWAVQENLDFLKWPAGPAAPAIAEPQRYDYGSHLMLAAAWAALFGVAGFFAQGRSVRALVPMLWSATSVFSPLAMLIALYYRIANLDRSLPFAALALLLAAIFALATENLLRREHRPGMGAASALYATGALAALALALTFALEKGWLTIALALMAPGAAWIAEKRPLPWLRSLAAIMAAVVTARVGWEPRIVGNDLGAAPIFNWLLYGYGVPAASFWLAGWLLRRRRDDQPARTVDAAAILFTVLLVVLEIRHYVTGGDMYQTSAGLTEIALYVNAGLAMTIGLEYVRRRSGSIVHNVGACIVAALTLVAIIADLVYVADPDLARDPVGPAFINLILLGYGIPAVLAITLALIARTTRPLPYRIAAAITAMTLALFYLTLEVRRLFHGPILAGPTGDAEQYMYSTVWLLFGIVVLAVGFFLRSQPARLLALGVIAVTIAKVFIVDTASISGIFRALSMIGLGVVLLGIGWLYQRLLYPRLPVASAPAPSG